MLDDGIIGGWATVNGTDFAGYIAPSGTSGGVGALGTTGYPAYSANTFATGVAADNIRVTATATSAAGPIFNSLNVAAAAATTLTVSGTLTLGSGGLLMNNGANAATITGGTGLTSGGAELFVYTNTGGREHHRHSDHRRGRDSRQERPGQPDPQFDEQHLRRRHGG